MSSSQSYLSSYLSSLYAELLSWLTPPPVPLSRRPTRGSHAPSSSQLVLPCGDHKPAIIAFLRHCGCPFAERTLLRMRSCAARHSSVHFIAISHSSAAHTEKWLAEVGGAGDVGIIVDKERTLYASFGLGTVGWWHVLSPWALWEVVRVAREEGIQNRPTRSGNRWQSGGVFVVDGEGVVRLGEADASAGDVRDFEALVKSLE